MSAFCCDPIPVGQERVTLTARDGDGAAAALAGVFHAPTLFEAGDLRLDATERGFEAMAVFARALAAHLAPIGGEVLAWERPNREAWRRTLEEVGFRAARRKTYVEAPLAGVRRGAGAGFVLRSLVEVGEPEFVARMLAASEGDPFEERKGADRDPEREWRELVEGAGARFDPTRWLLVDDAKGPVGVVLPQAHDEKSGTLFYVAVLPERRGEGLGTRLHAFGLERLADMGLPRYVGSTDVRNAPMLRVFARNGCTTLGTKAHYVPPAASPGTALPT